MRRINLLLDDIFNESLITITGDFIYVYDIIDWNTYPIKSAGIFLHETDVITYENVTHTKNGSFSAIKNDESDYDLYALGV